MNKDICFLSGAITFLIFGLVVLGIGIGSFFFMPPIVEKILHNVSNELIKLNPKFQLLYKSS